MTDTATREGSSPKSVRRRSLGARVLLATVVLAAILLGALLALLALGTLIPGLGALSTLAALFVGTLTPWFFIASLAVLAVGLLTWRAGLRRRGRTAVSLGAFGVIANAVAMTLLVVATSQAGGTINLAKATFGLEPIGAAAPDRQVSYTTTQDGDELALSIYEPDENEAPAPTIMYVHGGGWTVGTADQLSSEFRQLADDGYLVVSVEYELATPSKHTWDRTPAQIDCAAAWINSNADSIGADLTRLAYWGDSAGGNLAINAAYAAASSTTTSPCGDLPKPQVVIGDFPAVDVAAVYDSNFDLAGLSAHTFTTNYTGGTPSEYPDRYDAVSSERLITPDAPDTLVMIPKRDELVPPQPTYDWVGQAQDAGVSVDLVKIPLAMHVYTQQAYNSIGSQSHLSIAENYLAEHLK